MLVSWILSIIILVDFKILDDVIHSGYCVLISFYTSYFYEKSVSKIIWSSKHHLTKTSTNSPNDTFPDLPTFLSSCFPWTSTKSPTTLTTRSSGLKCFTSTWTTNPVSSHFTCQNKSKKLQIKFLIREAILNKRLSCHLFLVR